MKIAFIDVTTTVSFGGVQTAVWSLAIALTDLGHAVTVFGGRGEIKPDLRGRTVSIQTFAFTPRERILDLGSRFQRTGERKSFAKHAKAAVAEGKFDWIVLTKPFDFFWMSLLAKSAPHTRFVFMSGGTDFIAGDRKLAEQLHACVAVSHFNAWQVQTRYKRFPQVIYNGVDLELFHPPAPSDTSRTATRALLQASPTDTVVMFAGRLVGWKGIEYAIRALSEPALAKMTHVTLALVGDGAEESQFRQLAASLGLGRRVLFIGRKPHAEIAALYRAADIGLFPSIGDESFGITIAEAMAAGLPVIASHVGGIPEVVGNEGTAGVLVAPGDAAAIAVAIAALAQDASRRAALGTAARARIEHLFTWRQSAQRLLDALPAR